MRAFNPLQKTHSAHRKLSAAMAWAVVTGFAGNLGISRAVAAEEVQCPATLQTAQTAHPAPDSWSAAQQGHSSRLLYIEVYAGPWRDEQSLPPDDVQDAQGRQSLVWRLRGNPSAKGTWLVCTYQNTQVKLERRLPETISECLQVNSSDPKRVIKLLEQRCK